MCHSASLSLRPSSMIQAHDAHPAGVATRLGDFREAQFRACMQLVPNEGTSHMRTNEARVTTKEAAGETSSMRESQPGKLPWQEQHRRCRNTGFGSSAQPPSKCPGNSGRDSHEFPEP